MGAALLKRRLNDAAVPRPVRISVFGLSVWTVVLKEPHPSKIRIVTV